MHHRKNVEGDEHDKEESQTVQLWKRMSLKMGIFFSLGKGSNKKLLLRKVICLRERIGERTIGPMEKWIFASTNSAIDSSIRAKSDWSVGVESLKFLMSGPIRRTWGRELTLKKAKED